MTSKKSKDSVIPKGTTYVLTIEKPTKAYIEYVTSDLDEYFKVLKKSGNTIYLGKNLGKYHYDDADEFFAQSFNTHYDWTDDPELSYVNTNDIPDNGWDELEDKYKPYVVWERPKGSKLAEKEIKDEIYSNNIVIKNLKQEIKSLKERNDLLSAKLL